jgi:RHS repeat-associated protein
MYSYDALGQATVTGADPRRLEFLYDAKGRRRSRTLYTWDVQTQTWTLSETRMFVYDLPAVPAPGTQSQALQAGQWNCIFERRVDAAQTVTDTAYVWGLDLSGSMQGAGGVGGLLQASGNVGGALRAAIFYVYDGSRPRPSGGDGLSKGAQRATEGSSESEGRTATFGNVTALVDAADGSVVARYDYSPFGMTVLADGPAAAANPWRFSTKYHDSETSLVYYGYRYYSPEFGRWIKRDPIGERGGWNVFAAVANSWLAKQDALGLAVDVVELLSGEYDDLELKDDNRAGKLVGHTREDVRHIGSHTCYQYAVGGASVSLPTGSNMRLWEAMSVQNSGAAYSRILSDLQNVHGSGTELKIRYVRCRAWRRYIPESLGRDQVQTGQKAAYAQRWIPAKGKTYIALFTMSDIPNHTRSVPDGPVVDHFARTYRRRWRSKLGSGAFLEYSRVTGLEGPTYKLLMILETSNVIEFGWEHSE